MLAYRQQPLVAIGDMIAVAGVSTRYYYPDAFSTVELDAGHHLAANGSYVAWVASYGNVEWTPSADEAANFSMSRSGRLRFAGGVLHVVTIKRQGGLEVVEARKRHGSVFELL